MVIDKLTDGAGEVHKVELRAVYVILPFILGHNALGNLPLAYLFIAGGVEAVRGEQARSKRILHPVGQSDEVRAVDIGGVFLRRGA